MNEVTRILLNKSADDPQAAVELLPLVYDELRRLASLWLAQENKGQTLQPTALVHEAYLRLTGKDGKGPAWDNRGHFFAAAAEAMRRILVENARRKRRLKHGGGRQRIALEAVDGLVDTVNEDLIALDESLDRLAKLYPVKAEVVKLRYFGGLTMPEVAHTLNISLATAERYWAFARVWLYADLGGSAQE